MKLIDKKMTDKLAEDLGLKFLAKEKREEVMGRILELAAKRAGLRIVENLSGEELEEFKEIPAGDTEKIEKFLLAKNPKVKDIFIEEIEAVKKEMLEHKKGN